MLLLPPPPPCPTACFSLCFARLGCVRPPAASSASLRSCDGGVPQEAALFSQAAGTHPAAVHAPSPSCRPSSRRICFGPPHLGASSSRPSPPPLPSQRPGPSRLPPAPFLCVWGGSGAKGRCARGRVWATGRANDAQPTPNRSPPWAICLAATDLPSPSSLFFSPANDPLPQCLPPGGAVPPCQPSAGASAGRPRPVRQGQADVPVREARAAVRVKRLQAPR